MARPRFLLDENQKPLVKTALLRREPTIIIARIGDPDVPPLGTKDPDVLLYLETSGMLLITANRKSMPEHVKDHLQAGRHPPGIFRIPRGTTSMQIVEALHLIWAASDAEEWIDRFLWLPR
jgi:hypothetical protein